MRWLGLADESWAVEADESWAVGLWVWILSHSTLRFLYLFKRTITWLNPTLTMYKLENASITAQTKPKALYILEQYSQCSTNHLISCHWKVFLPQVLCTFWGMQKCALREICTKTDESSQGLANWCRNGEKRTYDWGGNEKLRETKILSFSNS